MIYLLTVEIANGYYYHYFYYQNEVIFIITTNFDVDYNCAYYKYVNDDNRHQPCGRLHFKTDEHHIVQYIDLVVDLPEYVNNFVLNKILENI